MSKKRKIAFFGSDSIALPCLDALTELSGDFEICGVLTQPDRPVGRGRKLQSNPIKNWAKEKHLPIMDPEKPGSQIIDWLSELGADISIVMAYGHILKEEILYASPLGCFNLHASLLPKYRGASPIETALAMGEKETGVTFMRVIPQMDAGPLVDFEKVSILSTDTGISLREKISHACVPLLLRSMPTLLSKSFLESSQDEERVSYCRKLNKRDGQLDFLLSAEEIECRFRAFTGWPGTWFLHNDTCLKVGKLCLSKEKLNLKPGVRSAEKKDSLIVGTGDGAVELLELQKPGGKMMAVSDFLRGYPLPIHVTFPANLEKIALVR